MSWFMNIYDNTKGTIFREEYEDYYAFLKRYNKLKYSKKLFVLSHSSLD